MVKKDRKPTRAKGYDYSQPGAYFVTICVKNMECALGKIVDGFVHLSRDGNFVYDAWNDLPRHYLHANLDEFVVMPNHVHGIIIIVGEVLGAFQVRSTLWRLSQTARTPTGVCFPENPLKRNAPRGRTKYW